MKKCAALMLAVALLLSLCACGKSAEEETLVLPVETAAPTPEPTAEPTPEPTPEPTAVPTPQPREGNYNPLTGEPTETDISQNRPYAAMLNTIWQALPQSGNSQADMLIEATEEGGITRIMGLYQDLSDVGTIGTIRSTREYYVFLAMGFDALLVHAGCSTTADEELSEHNYATVNYLGAASYAFWRDAWRLENVATEHSLYTSGENLLSYVENSGVRAEHEEGFESPYFFTDDGTPADGQSAQTVTVTFSDYKTTRFEYDEESKTYQVYAYDEPFVDEAADTQVAVTNIVVIPTEQTSIDGGVLQRFDLSEGEGYFACGGKYIPIHWEKGGEEDPLRLFGTDGSVLELGVGKSYVCLLGDTCPITFE